MNILASVASVAAAQPVQRLCSNCRQPGHSIRWCFDDNIDVLLLQCQEQSLRLSEAVFKVWLSFENANLLKAVCMRLGLTATLAELGNKHSTINHITNDFYRNQRFNALLIEFANNLQEINNIDPYPMQTSNSTPNTFTPNTFTPNTITIKLKNEDEEREQEDKEREQEDPPCCPVCYESDNLGKYEHCNHVICANCFHGIKKTTSNITCSLCRTPVTQINIFSDKTLQAFKKGV